MKIEYVAANTITEIVILSDLHISCGQHHFDCRFRDVPVYDSRRNSTSFLLSSPNRETRLNPIFEAVHAKEKLLAISLDLLFSS